MAYYHPVFVESPTQLPQQLLTPLPEELQFASPDHVIDGADLVAQWLAPPSRKRPISAVEELPRDLDGRLLMQLQPISGAALRPCRSASDCSLNTTLCSLSVVGNGTFVMPPVSKKRKRSNCMCEIEFI